MMAQGAGGYPDAFEIVNGPEDGTEFPVTRTPVDIGADPGCGVLIQCDKSVQRFHARVTVVSEGYRIRKLHGGPIYVDGRRAGALRSRIARNNSLITVGGTELMLRCAPDGLASRSHGLPTESDLGWTLRLLIPFLLSLVKEPIRWVRNLAGRHFWLIVVIAALIAATAYFRPSLLSWARAWVMYGFEWVRYFCFDVYYRIRGV